MQKQSDRIVAVDRAPAFADGAAKRYTERMGYLGSDDLIGHDAPRGFLARSLANSRHHAFLFSGSAHLGKDAVARAFVSDALGRPVNEWSDLAANPDVFVLGRALGEKNIGIEDARAFINHFTSSSFSGGRKIGVIRGAQDLSLDAANALLKTLEEPAANALIVLLADGLDRMPETVKSRCQLVRFLPVPFSVVRDGLVLRGKTLRDAESAAAFSIGRPGLAVQYAESADLRVEHDRLANSFIELCQSPISRRFAMVLELTNKAEVTALSPVLDSWISVLRDALSIRTSNDRYASRPDSHASIAAYASDRRVAQLVASIRAAHAAKRLLAENVNPRLIFENIAFSL